MKDIQSHSSIRQSNDQPPRRFVYRSAGSQESASHPMRRNSDTTSGGTQIGTRSIEARIQIIAPPAATTSDINAEPITARSIDILI